MVRYVDHYSRMFCSGDGLMDCKTANKVIRHANFLIDKKKYAEAEVILDGAIEECCDYSTRGVGNLFGARGLVRKRQGRLEEALEDYNRSIELHPYLNSSYVNRAVTLYKLKRYSECVADFMVGYQLGFAYNKSQLKLLSKARELLQSSI